jgi:hypothetical protein
MRIRLDPETAVVAERHAIVYAPRRTRDRFPDSCVELVDSSASALAEADPARHRYPAVVMGPSRSSEGVRLYYLVHWLDQAAE